MYSKLIKKWWNSYLFSLFFSCLLSFLLASCSARTDYVRYDPELSRESQMLHHYLLGQFSALNGDLSDAMSYISLASRMVEGESSLLHAQLAQLKLQSGNPNAALNEIKKVLDVDPDNISILLLMAGVYDSIGQLPKALVVYKKVLKIDPENIDAHIFMAGIYVRQEKFEEALESLKIVNCPPKFLPLVKYYQGRILEFKGDVEAALKLYLDAFESNVIEGGIVDDILRIFIASEQYGEALAFCKQVLKVAPKRNEVRKSYAHLLIRENALELAIKQFEVLVKNEFDQENSLLKIALIRIQQENYIEAEKLLEKILDKYPKNNDARFYLASTYDFNNKRDKAVQELLKIKAPKKLFTQAYTYAALLLKGLGDVQGALTAIKKAFLANPQSKRIESVLLAIIREVGDVEEKFKVLDECIAAAPQDVALKYRYAVILKEQNRDMEAINIMRMVLQLEPENADALNFIAYLNAENEKNLNEALRLAKKAVSIRPNNGYFRDTLGYIYFKLGNSRHALKYFEDANEIVNNDIVIMMHHAEVLEVMQKWSEALKIYKKIKALKVSGLQDLKFQQRAILAVKRLEKNSSRSTTFEKMSIK